MSYQLRQNIELGRSSLGAQTFQVFLMRVGGLGIAFLANLPLTRWLGLSGYGEYAYITSWITILTIPFVAIGTLVVRETAITRQQDDADMFARLLQWSLRTTLYIGSALVFVGLGLIWVPAASFRPGLVLAGVLGMAGIPFIGLQTVIAAVFRGCHRTGAVVLLVEIIPPALMIIWAGAFLLFSVPGSASLALAGRLAALAVVLFICIPLLSRLRVQGCCCPPNTEQRAKWRAGLYSFSLLKSFDILARRLPVVILALFLAPESVALFCLSSRIAETVSFSLSIVSLTTAPRLAELHAKRDYPGIQRLVARSTLAISAWAIPLASLLIVAGRMLLRCFGSQFEAGYPILIVLVLGQTVDAITGTVGLVMNMGGLERVVAKTYALGLLVTIVLCVALIPQWGAMGAAAGVTSALVLWNVVLVFQLYHRLGIVSTLFLATASRTTDVHKGSTE